MAAEDRTPVLIGVGEASERVEAADYSAASPVELAARAARAALADTGAAGLAPHIDVIAAIRQFEISTPAALVPFGRADNFPRAVGRRIGADPARAILEVTGGQGPQRLVNEFCHAVAAGEAQMVLLVGSEAISTVRDLAAKGEKPDWSEAVGGQLEDRGYGLDGLLTPDLTRNGPRTPIQVYALFENARRARLGLDRAAYAQDMGRLFSPFTKIAAGNPHAMSREAFTPDELATVTARNRLTSDPFPRRMVARDQANQGAAVLLTSVERARALGVRPERWIYLHGGADVKERTVMERQDLSASPAAIAAVRQALAAAGAQAEALTHLDLYSCFPVAVSNVADALGLAADDRRGLTVTGGLPFFGGAGNNYAMHAIASVVRLLRGEPEGLGMVGANGGFLSKYSVGVYSARPIPWRPFSSQALQAQIDSWPAPPRADHPAGAATVETYTIDHGREAPRVMVIARTPDGGRFASLSDDQALVGEMIARDPLRAALQVASDAQGRTTITGWTPA